MGRGVFCGKRTRVPATGDRDDGCDAIVRRVPSSWRPRLDHAVELPDVANRPLRGARPDRRQHGGREARERVAAIRVEPRDGISRGRSSDGVFQIVVGDRTTATALIRSPVSVVSLTGSVRTGAYLAREASKDLKKARLER